MTDPVVIEARDVSRVLPGPVPVTLVQDIEMTVREAEFVAVTGPSGSGKSSLLYLLGLLDHPTSGRILLDGEDTTARDERGLADTRLRKIGFVFQFHFLLPEFSVLGNVMVPMRRLGRLPEKAMRERAEGLLADFGLADQMKKRPDQVSGGQRQRVAIARALANQPRIILCDEPTGNLDSHSSANVFEIFADLVRKQGATIVAVTHDLDFAAGTDRRIHLVDGRIVEDGPNTGAPATVGIEVAS